MSEPRSTKSAVGVAAAGAGAAALATAVSACCVPVIAPLVVAVVGAGGAAWAAGLKPYSLAILAGVGAAFQQQIANMGSPAWDVWMLFAPGVLWEGEAPPAPTWWEHQLSGLKDYADLRLDPDRFAGKALEMSAAAD